MKCRDARILLADYAAGALTGEERATVQAHLDSCAGCREELAFLKEYGARIATYPALKAPAGFIASLHGRLHVETRRSVARKLFLPLKIKLPLHAAGILAMSILALIAIRPLLRDDAYQPAEAPVALSSKEKVSAPPSGEKRVDHDRPEIAVTERRKDTISVTAHAPDDAAVADSLPENTAGSRAGVPEGPTLYLSRAAQPAPVSPMRDSFRAKKLESPASKQMDRALMEEGEAPGEGSDLISGLARSLGGTSRGGEPGTVVAEIPAERYADFLKGLRSRWIVRESPGSPAPPESGKMRITLHLND